MSDGLPGWPNVRVMARGGRTGFWEQGAGVAVGVVKLRPPGCGVSVVGMRLLGVLLFLVMAGGLVGAEEVVATFSIVAVDKETGELGVAVQSKFVAVGSVVPWAKAGVGAVATQAWANTGYGPRGLKLMGEGKPAEAVVELLTAEDERRALRQIGVVDGEGRAATYTGAECQDWAGGKTGVGYAVQGNILVGAEVVEAIAEVFEKTEGVLAERLLAALEAGQAAGGDKRGRQSAALLVVREGWGYSGFNDRFRDLRVDDHPQPIEELKRVYAKHREVFPRPSEPAE